MECKVCRKKTTRTINKMCPDCYIKINIPTKVANFPWIYASSIRTRLQKLEVYVDKELASKIVDGKCELDRDRQNIRIDEMIVSLTVEALDDLAVKTGILVGKWLIYRDESEIDEFWKNIARAVFDGELGISAKVSTAFQRQKRYVSCIYTYNYLDLEDVNKIRDKLRRMGFAEKLCYKPDIYTYLNIYSGTTTLSPCRHRD